MDNMDTHTIGTGKHYSFHFLKVEVKVLNFKHSDYSDTPTYDKVDVKK